MKLIFGLGNPGEEYANTYHNLGFLALDEAAAALGCKIEKKKGKSLIGECFCGGEKVVLVKPLTYMNSSGESVRELVDFYKCDLSDVLVIYDDIDLEKGFLRYKPGGSAGTHNGMRSIVSLLGSQGFARLRIGSKNENPAIPLIKYVLMAIPKSENQIYADVFERAKSCVLDFARGKSGDELMCNYNGNAKSR